MEKISFITEEGVCEEFYIEEETRIGGVSYILVSDSQDEEANAYIMKDVSKPTDEEAIYEFVEDEDELDGVFRVFTEMMEDVDLES